MGNLKIIRTPKSKETKFVRIDLGIYRDTQLSLSAMGLLSYLLSHNQSYHLSKEQLSKKFDMSIKSFRKVWNELVDAGYIMESKQHIEGRWSWSYTISEFTTGRNTTGRKTTGCKSTNIRTNNRRTNKLRTTNPLKNSHKESSYGDIKELSSNSATRK